MIKWIKPIILVALVGSPFANEKEGIQLKGDFRYRHELTAKEGAPQRNRERVRARVSLKGQVNEQIKAVVGLATGGSDPLSTNQTLSGNFSTKGIQLDKAFITYENGPIELQLGKMKNPLAKAGKSELIWDGDVTPEGAALGITFKPLFVNLASFWIKEDKSSSEDLFLYSGQAGAKATLSSLKVLAGIGYHSFANIKGASSIHYKNKSMGNSLDTAGLYLNDYNLIEVFGSVKIPSALPVNLFVHLVKNLGASEDGLGWTGGASLGKVKKPGSWSAKASWKQVEKDAVIGALTDSDFIGGGTDGSGLEASVAVGVLPKTKLQLSYFLNQIKLTDGKSYHKVQADASVKF